MSKERQGSGTPDGKNEQLNEPAPVLVPDTPQPGDGRIHVHDGMDNSDLRLLQDLAIEQAKAKE